ncbi:MAG: glycosyltransferase family 2 protein [Acidobacteria bacterium]|nr:glycosyltransferase family 2 protein [Acidobacteriota bacterium]
MLPISAVIITLNEERRLPRALESLSVADEILVVDSGSTDGTRQVAERYGARFLVYPWEGYSQQKNYAASQASHPWVLSLDADEALSPELAEELRRLKQQGPGDAVGFQMPRLASYQGRWIRHCGWYPDLKLRLYDRRRGRWGGNYVHEHVEVDGPVQTLQGDLHHFTCDSFQEHLERIDRYTTLAAREAFANGSRSVWAGMLAGPPWKFVETYFFRQGFRDGFPGLVIAAMAGLYVFLKYAKLFQIVQQSRESQAPGG